MTSPSTPSCDLGDEDGKNIMAGDCFIGGVVRVVTGNLSDNRGFNGGGFFTGIVAGGVIIDRSLHGGGRKS